MANNFEEAWQNLSDHLAFRHSIESDRDAGTPPYEESRYFGWGDDDSENEGYDDSQPEESDAAWESEFYEDQYDLDHYELDHSDPPEGYDDSD